MPADVSLRDIYQARHRIAPFAVRTPLLSSPPLSERVGASMRLKLENVQETGAFKIRGAANKLVGLSDERKSQGVITYSTGNHGLAVSTVAQKLGIDAVVCLSERVPRNRVEALQRVGAEVVVHGASQDVAGEWALHLQEERDLIMVDPFDDPAIIAGQGTIGLELMEDWPSVDTVVVPLSGGGLISGIALALKSAAPDIRVIGVSMERAPVMYHSLQAGQPIEMEEEDTLAHSLAGGIGLDNRYTFCMVQRYVDDVVLVSEREIAAGMAFLLKSHRLVVEGAGAVGVAALLAGRVRNLGERVAVVVSGGNVALPVLLDVAGIASGDRTFDSGGSGEQA